MSSSAYTSAPVCGSTSSTGTGTPSHDRRPVIEAPTGITFVAHENPPGIATDQRVQHFRDSDRAPWYNHTNLTAHPEGGHFIPWEIPDAWVADLRRTLRPPLRG